MILLTNILLWQLSILHDFNPKQAFGPQSLQHTPILLCLLFCVLIYTVAEQKAYRLRIMASPSKVTDMLKRNFFLHLLLTLFLLSHCPMAAGWGEGSLLPLRPIASDQETLQGYLVMSLILRKFLSGNYFTLP